MPAEKNTTLRVVVPVIVVAVSIALVAMVYRGATRPGAPTTTPSPTITPATDPGAAPELAPDSPTSPGSVSPGSLPAASHSTQAGVNAPTTGAALAGLRAQTAVFDSAAAPPAPIGSLDSRTGYSAEVTFTLVGAGVQSIILSDHYKAIDRKEHYAVQQLATVPLADGTTLTLSSLAVREVEIDGQRVNLYSDTGVRFWREAGAGRFEALIVDEKDAPVLRLTRVYTLAQGSYEIAVEQRAENLTDRAIVLVWRQYGPIDLPADVTGYGLDVRRVRFGHLLASARDPSRQIVEADGNLTSRATVISNVKAGKDELWPDAANHKSAGELVWMAQTSRYFAFAVHPLLDEAAARANLQDPQAHPLAKGLNLVGQAHALLSGTPGDERVLVQLTSGPIGVGPGERVDLSFGAYAGPLGRSELSEKSSPVFGALGVSQLLVYNLGGMCAFCTFQPLARGLLAYLALLHDWVVRDWAVAIMILVVCVRAVLHPVTRKSQISMALFSRKMQALAPKQQKIRERYKDDPKRMQQEMVRLMREEKVSYAGMLGCLPMFLQTPVWIALYAMLYFSFELRHQAAFYGVFQAVSGGAWSFMGDLSAADHFVDFGRTLFTLPLFGHVTGLNVLPMLLGVVFFMQQKYLTPPPSATLTPEQIQQQKMMKVMTVVMFPVLMYNAPCGLTVYFITNSTLGILESRWIRAHVDQLTKGQSPEGPEAPLGRKKVSNTAGAPGAGTAGRRGRLADEDRKRFKDR